MRVGYAANLPEAEMMQELLRTEGIPSMLQRSLAFSVPDFLAAGRRDILVPQADAEMARELLQPDASARRPADA